MKRFGDWFAEKMVEYDMKPTDFQPYGMSSAVVSNFVNHKRQPSPESCQIIAKAFKMPLEEVYRAAGILPPKPDADPLIDAVMNLMEDLQREDKEDILAYAKLRHQLAAEKHNLKPNRKGVVSRTASA